MGFPVRLTPVVLRDLMAGVLTLAGHECVEEAVCFKSNTTEAWMDSLRPMGPTCSPVFALKLIDVIGISMREARRLRMTFL